MSRTPWKYCLGYYDIRLVGCSIFLIKLQKYNSIKNIYIFIHVAVYDNNLFLTRWHSWQYCLSPCAAGHGQCRWWSGAARPQCAVQRMSEASKVSRAQQPRVKVAQLPRACAALHSIPATWRWPRYHFRNVGSGQTVSKVVESIYVSGSLVAFRTTCAFFESGGLFYTLSSKSTPA